MQGQAPGSSDCSFRSPGNPGLKITARPVAFRVYLCAPVRGNDMASIFSRVLCPTADLNSDCRVDIADFCILAGQWLDEG